MTRGIVAILGGAGMDNSFSSFGCNFDKFQHVFSDPVTAI